jgi:hypothetical protein
MIYIKNVRLIKYLPESLSPTEHIDLFINTATRNFSLLQKNHRRIAIRAEDILKIKILDKNCNKIPNTGLQLSLFEIKQQLTNPIQIKYNEIDFHLYITYLYKKQKNILVIESYINPFIVFTTLTKIVEPYGTPFYWTGNPILLTQCVN